MTFCHVVTCTSTPFRVDVEIPHDLLSCGYMYMPCGGPSLTFFFRNKSMCSFLM